MKIAILGASSQIAKDLIFSMRDRVDYELILYGRCMASIASWLTSVDLNDRHLVCGYEDYGVHPHDVVMNFIGVGDPARAEKMGEEIFDITYKFDRLVLDDLKKNPNRKYLFLSSGSVYGSDFNNPVNSFSKACVNINSFTPQAYYPLAKLYAECRHRALQQYNIVDLRIFNYFSSSVELSSKFFLTDVVNAVISKIELTTINQNIFRDYLTPQDFVQIIDCVIKHPPMNLSIDCYSRKSVSKFEILDMFCEKFNLKYKFLDVYQSINATGHKKYYYSDCRLARDFGYNPKYSSLEGLEIEAAKIFAKF